MYSPVEKSFTTRENGTKSHVESESNEDTTSSADPSGKLTSLNCGSRKESLVPDDELVKTDGVNFVTPRRILISNNYSRKGPLAPNDESDGNNFLTPRRKIVSKIQFESNDDRISSAVPPRKLVSPSQTQEMETSNRFSPKQPLPRESYCKKIQFESNDDRISSAVPPRKLVSPSQTQEMETSNRFSPKQPLPRESYCKKIQFESNDDRISSAVPPRKLVSPSQTQEMETSNRFSPKQPLPRESYCKKVESESNEDTTSSADPAGKLTSLVRINDVRTPIKVPPQQPLPKTTSTVPALHRGTHQQSELPSPKTPHHEIVSKVKQAFTEIPSSRRALKFDSVNDSESSNTCFNFEKKCILCKADLDNKICKATREGLLKLMTKSDVLLLNDTIKLGWEGSSDIVTYITGKIGRYHKRCYARHTDRSEPPKKEEVERATKNIVIWMKSLDISIVPFTNIIVWSRKSFPEVSIATLFAAVKTGLVCCYNGDLPDLVCLTSRFKSAMGKIRSDVISITELRKDMSAYRAKFSGSLADMPMPPDSLRQHCHSLVYGSSGAETSKVGDQISSAILYSFVDDKQHRQAPRHCRKRESKPILELSLRTYILSESKNLSTFLFNRGMCLPYHRLRGFVISVAQMVEETMQKYNAFLPVDAFSDTFSIYSLDNLDANKRVTFRKDHFHGVAMVCIQFVTPGDKKLERTKYVEVKTFLKKYNVAELQDVTIPKEYFVPAGYYNTEYDDELSDEVLRDAFEKGLERQCEWLEDHHLPWAEFNSNEIKGSGEAREHVKVHYSHFPLLTESINSHSAVARSLKMHRHAHIIISPMQFAIISACDQPVYARAMEVLWFFCQAYKFKHFILLGALHVQKAILLVFGQLVKTSGIIEILNACKFSIDGAGNVLQNVTDIAGASYIVQVVLCVIHRSYKEGVVQENQFWDTVRSLGATYLVFMASIRSGNFFQYVASLQSMMPYFAVFNRTNYLRWGMIHLEDLRRVKTISTELFEAFVSGKFTGNKSGREFSSMAIDQIYEQANKDTKGHQGALGGHGAEMLQRAVPFWQNELSECTEEQSDTSEPKPHHSVGKRSRQRFQEDIENLQNAVFSDPYSSPVFKRISDGEVLDPDMVGSNRLRNLYQDGFKKYQDLVEKRLRTREEPLTKPITQYQLPECLLESKQTAASKDTSKISVKDFGLIQKACEDKPDEGLDVVQAEFVKPVPGCFQSSDGTPHFPTSKSLLLGAIRKEHDGHNGCNKISGVPAPGPVVCDLSFVTRTLAHSKKEGSLKDFYDTTWGVVQSFRQDGNRLDIVTDDYSKPNILKAPAVKKRSSGNSCVSRKDLSLHETIPTDFGTSFFESRENKHLLYSSMITYFERLIGTDTTSRQRVLTKGRFVVGNVSNLSELQPCDHQEADTRTVLHAIELLREYDSVTIRANDTDILIICVGFIPRIPKTKNILLQFGALKKPYILSSRRIAETIGARAAYGLPMLHAISGCDYIPNFYYKGKAKWWNNFTKDPSIAKVFCQVLKKPKEVPKFFKDIELFILEKIYNAADPESGCAKVRLEMLKAANSADDVRLICPSEDALQQQILRAVYVSRFWMKSNLKIMNLPPQREWGWCDQNQFKWNSKPIYQHKLYDLTYTCGCRTSDCTKCKCRNCWRKCACGGYCKKVISISFYIIKSDPDFVTSSGVATKSGSIVKYR
eukprot:sb/3460723/